MKKTTLILATIFLSLQLSVGLSYGANGKENKLRKTVVKIHSVSSSPDYFSPWKTSDYERSLGSGVVIKGKRILTNAHVVSNEQYLQVQPYGSPKKYDAQVLFISHEADLAILTVEDDEFFKDRGYSKIGTLPETMEEVLVYGYPTGGSSLSITKGILSRVVFDSYVHSGIYFMAGQVDAAINPGNSGGPIMVDGKIVGVVMQGLNGRDVENIGYMIPPSVLNHFLDDVKDGSYDGFPIKGFRTQSMENTGMKKKYKMKDDETGVLVSHVFWNSTFDGAIKKGDVILAVEGHDIADDSTIEFRDKERLYFTHYLNGKQVGDNINFKVLRDGKQKDVSYELKQAKGTSRLVQQVTYDVLPEYFIFGGVVFSPLTKNLICEWEGCKAPAALSNLAFNTLPTEKQQEAVVALQVLPADVNEGFHGLSSWIIKKVNNKSFKNFEDFYAMVMKDDSDFVMFEDSLGRQVVIDRKEATESSASILETYNVKSDRFLYFEQ